ncbi:alpha/beta hydrolase [Flavobacterium hydatis]|uniref:Alpha/beta hydrolase n=1 Tax=Flavobacterium hydatis TaxID=991 RepID=A0A086AUC2_FLAHY|nr:alpha/beta hydrolase [Flavobacterium hydatis]KFF20286.1 alpha/beta hydrolase [Flavobacterium hydatis]OXA98424.1 alpha/beta hydrolase [Flavobacterium hydatis]
MKITFLFSFLFLAFLTNAQTLYIKTYGNKTDSPIIFIHGGPSGNATLFEGTNTAEELSKRGFYVIAYDRRGEGRSIDTNATFTYNEAFKDLNTIYKTYNLKKATLLAHSFGGLVATLYVQKYPEKIKSLVLAGALFSQQKTYNHILDSVKKIYTKNNDLAMLDKVSHVEKLDKNSAEYRKGCFELAGENNFFKIPKPTVESKALYHQYEISDFYKTNIRNKNAPLLFYKNEKQNNIDTKPILQQLKKKRMPIYAIYGKQDGIFSVSEIDALKNIVGKQNFVLIDNCSHYLFVDQQKEFLDSIYKWLK